MSQKVRAKVYRHATGQWFATAYLSTDYGTPLDAQLFAAMPSHPEALQAAQVLMKTLDEELMEEVHESRSNRRATKENAT